MTKLEAKKIHILIVDDEPDVHAVLGKMLVKEYYNIRSVYNADDALKEIEERRPDLIILDVMMPKVSGMELCKKLKGDPKTKDILILIVSARDEQEDRIYGLAKGADDYVSKPFHIRSLLRKIEHMLEKRKTLVF